MSHGVRRVAPALATAVQGAWLMLGITVLLFLGLEFTYRGLAALARGPSPASAVDSPQHPYANKPWWPELQRDLALRRNLFDPYRSHWGLPLGTRYVNVDSDGYRITPQRSVSASAPVVFMLGGSTMWGYTARDSATIPALTATALEGIGAGEVLVKNLAQAAFNTTQEMNTLLLELIRGGRPVVAVFLDGYNDIATAAKYGEPGHSYGDESIQAQINLGSRGFWAELFGLGRHSVLVQRLLAALGAIDRPPRVRGSPESVCGPLAAYYRNVTSNVQGMGNRYGFRAVFFLQPHHSVSRKPKTAWERRLAGHRAVAPCMASIDSAMADRRDLTFRSLAGLFDGDTATVFVDENAHVTEDGNRRIAAAIAAVVAPLLEARGAATR